MRKRWEGMRGTGVAGATIGDMPGGQVTAARGGSRHSRQPLAAHRRLQSANMDTPAHINDRESVSDDLARQQAAQALLREVYPALFTDDEAV